MILPSNLDEFIPITCNTEDDAVFANMAHAVSLDLPWLQVTEAHEGIAVIVGGGPSLLQCIPMIAARKAAGQMVFATNGAAKALRLHDVDPDYFVLLDARPRNAGFIDPDSGAHNLIASQCHPDAFKAVAGRPTTLWHPNYPGVADYIGDRICALIGGGTTVGLQALSIAYAMGFREIHVYGMDSSYSGDVHHAYAQPGNDADVRRDVTVNDKTFSTAPWMARQAMEFQTCAAQLSEGGCNVHVHGSGLLPEIAKAMSITALTAVYDLSSSPPTFDFVGFLHEAEKARIAGGHAHLDIVFQPGPSGGFRQDDLPPRLSMREGMLWRVCVPLARMLPSVRDITVLKKRRVIESAVFPEGWQIDYPVSHYGNAYCFDLQPILRPSDLAREYVADTFKHPFVAINLRSSQHWPGRNSDFKSWHIIAAHLNRIGLDVVWVPDEDGKTPSTHMSFACQEAFWDLDIRAALFEKAELVLATAGGAMMMMGSLHCRWLAFIKPDPEFIAGTPEFYARVGWGENHQISSNGKIVWGEGDTPEIVIPEIDRVLRKAEAA